MNKSDMVKGILVMLLASLLNASQMVVGKFAVTDSGTIVLLFFRMGISFFLTLGLTRILHHNKGSYLEFVRPKRVKLHIIRAATMLIATYSIFYSLKYTPASNTTVLFLTMPLFTPIISRIFIKEKFDPIIWIGMIMGFIGTYLILDPKVGDFNYHSLFALVGGVFGAASLVTTRALHSYETSLKILLVLYFLSFIVSGLVLAGYALVDSTELDMHVTYVLLFAGLLGYFYQAVLNKAYHFAPAHVVTPFLFVTLIFTIIADFFIWHIIHPFQAYIGMALIVVGTILIIYLPKKRGYTLD